VKTALGLAQAECANYQSGSCLGLERIVPAGTWLGPTAWTDGQMIDCDCVLHRKRISVVPEPRQFNSLTGLGQYLNEQEGKPLYPGATRFCRYFDRQVRPLERAAKKVKSIGKVSQDSDRTCECGASIDGRKWFCKKCLKQRQRDRQRQKGK